MLSAFMVKPRSYTLAAHTSSAKRHLDCSEVDLLHLYHRTESAFCHGGAGVRNSLRHDKGLSAKTSPSCPCTSHTRFPGRRFPRSRPIAICLLLIRGGNLKRECLTMREHRSAFEPKARNSHHAKLYRQHIALLTRRKIAQCVVNGVDERVGKSSCVKACGLFGTAVVPKADGVLCGQSHINSPVRFLSNTP